MTEKLDYAMPDNPPAQSVTTYPELRAAFNAATAGSQRIFYRHYAGTRLCGSIVQAYSRRRREAAST